jgi:hypothetical protein
MTETLADKTCTPCRGGVPPLAREEALRLQSHAPDWELRDDARRIERTFRFRNFQEALAFVQQVGELAESRNADDCSWAYSRRRSYCVLAANIRLCPYLPNQECSRALTGLFHFFGRPTLADQRHRPIRGNRLWQKA